MVALEYNTLSTQMYHPPDAPIYNDKCRSDCKFTRAIETRSRTSGVSVMKSQKGSK